MVVAPRLRTHRSDDCAMDSIVSAYGTVVDNTI